MEGKSSGRAPIKCKKENIRLPKNNSNVKNVRLKISIDKMSSLSASKTNKIRELKLHDQNFLMGPENLFDLHDFSNYMGSNYRRHPEGHLIPFRGLSRKHTRTEKLPKLSMSGLARVE